MASRRRSHTKLTLSATDEFWHASVSKDLPPSEIDGGDNSDSVAATIDVDEGDRSEGASLPPAHRQLLSSDPAYAEDLKGHDHNLQDDGHEEEGRAGDEPLCFSRRGPPAHRRSGGSWLRVLVGWDDSAAPEREAPGLVEVPGGLSLDPDECSSSSDDESLPSKPARRGVSFNPSVVVQPIPHSSALSEEQRRRMYSTVLEMRRNKARNKREFKHDGYDWREATEEWEMGICMVTGELVHPAHEGC